MKFNLYQSQKQIKILKESESGKSANPDQHQLENQKLSATIATLQAELAEQAKLVAKFSIHVHFYQNLNLDHFSIFIYPGGQVKKIRNICEYSLFFGYGFISISTSTNLNMIKFKSNDLCKVKDQLYLVTQRIGRGGFSDVFHCISHAKSKSFALKKVNLKDLDEQNTKLVMNEIELLKKLQSSDKVVQLYD